MEHLKLNIGPSASKLNMKSFKTSKGQRTLSTRKPIPLIIDTDLAFGSDSADIDDALAILLALAHPEQFDVLAVTAVSGNVDGVRASANIDILLDRIGFGHIPHCASDKISRLGGANIFYDLELPEDYKIETNYMYRIDTGSGWKKINSMKQLRKFYKKKSDRFDQYVSEQNITFDEPARIAELVQWMEAE